MPSSAEWACLTLANELSEETGTDKERLLERSAWAEGSRIREPRRTALPCGLLSRVLWLWAWIPGCLWSVILSQVLRGGPRIAQPGWIPVRRILGGWQDIWAGSPLSF